MIFHEPSRQRLVACWKRAKSFARPGVIDKAHPLAAAWDNCKLFLDAQDNFGTSADPKERLREQVEELVYSLTCLDWFAQKLDAYSKQHMLAGDDTIAAILHEWKSRVFFDPVIAYPR